MDDSDQELLTALFEHSWTADLPARLHSACEGVRRAEVSLNLLDIVFDLEAGSVTLSGLWADDGTDRVPALTMQATDFWQLVEARVGSRDWRSRL